MGDHLFEFAILEALLSGGDRARLNLAIDRKIESIFDLEDAMKVATSGDKVVSDLKNARELRRDRHRRVSLPGHDLRLPAPRPARGRL